MSRILLLGAYGLAGRAIAEAIVRTSSHVVLASGRRHDRLAAQFAGADPSRLQILPLDATDARALGELGDAVTILTILGGNLGTQ